MDAQASGLGRINQEQGLIDFALPQIEAIRRGLDLELRRRRSVRELRGIPMLQVGGGLKAQTSSRTAIGKAPSYQQKFLFGYNPSYLSTTSVENGNSLRAGGAAHL